MDFSKCDFSDVLQQILFKRHCPGKLKQLCHKNANLLKVHSITLRCYADHSGPYTDIFSNIYNLALIVHCAKRAQTEAAVTKCSSGDLKACNFKTLSLFKKRLQHKCFPVNIPKILRTPF